MFTTPIDRATLAVRPVTLSQLSISVLKAPLAEPIKTSFGVLKNRTMVIVGLTSSDGTTGSGESWVNFPGWAADERVATLAEGVVPILRAHPEGTPAEQYLRLSRALSPLGRQWGAPGPISQAISAVDVAMWDLVGRLSECPCDTGRSRVRDRIPVYASGLGPSNHREHVEAALEAGHTAVKVKIGFGREKDAAALQLVREVGGDKLQIFTDANQAFTVDEATDMVPILRDVGVEWIEEPVRGDQLSDLEEFHRRTDFPIATGENLYGVENFSRYLHSPAVAAIQPDLSKMGGLTPALTVADDALDADCDVFPHLFNGALAYAASLTFTALAPAARLLELDVRENPFRDPLMIAPPRVIDGTVEIPGGAGHGVELDPEKVEEYRVALHQFDLGN